MFRVCVTAQVCQKPNCFYLSIYVRLTSGVPPRLRFELMLLLLLQLPLLLLQLLHLGRPG